MSEQQHHHHHSHHDDYASRFKRKSLQSIEFRRKADKWLKIFLLIVALFMIVLVIAAYLFG
jgi:Co/Zn/Cd efflux system component